MKTEKEMKDELQSVEEALKANKGKSNYLKGFLAALKWVRR